MKLKSDWYNLFLPFQAKPALIQKTFSQLVTIYSSHERYYHNLSHIQHILNIINLLESFANNLPILQMAAWFHDVIYDPQSNQNEENSTKFAATSLMNLNVPSTTINHVSNIILYTQTHCAPVDDIDGQIFLDADLSILGSEESEYLAYTQAIRREYSWLSDEDYKIGRKKRLQDFLDQEKIYFTKKAWQMFESKARDNLRKEILELSK